MCKCIILLAIAATSFFNSYGMRTASYSYRVSDVALYEKVKEGEGYLEKKELYEFSLFLLGVMRGKNITVRDALVRNVLMNIFKQGSQAIEYLIQCAEKNDSSAIYIVGLLKYHSLMLKEAAYKTEQDKEAEYKIEQENALQLFFYANTLCFEAERAMHPGACYMLSQLVEDPRKAATYRDFSMVRS